MGAWGSRATSVRLNWGDSKAKYKRTAGVLSVCGFSWGDSTLSGGLCCGDYVIVVLWKGFAINII